MYDMKRGESFWETWFPKFAFFRYMENVKDLFHQFVDDLKNKERKKTVVVAAEKFYGEIENSSEEIRDPVDLEEILRSSKTGKEKKRDLLLRFYRFYENKTGIAVESDLEDKVVVDNSQERLFAILQYTQTHPIEVEAMADFFMTSTKSMGKIAASLENGQKLMGKEIKIPIEREGWKRYSKVSYHPILLNLTMPEVTAMTIGLMEVAKDEKLYSDQFIKIAKDVYNSLTNYGKGCLSKLIKDKGMADAFNREIRDYEYSITSNIITMMKTGKPGTIQINSNGTDYLFIDCYVISDEGESIQIRTKNGKEKWFPISDVYSCECHMDRKDDFE